MLNLFFSMFSAGIIFLLNNRSDEEKFTTIKKENLLNIDFDKYPETCKINLNKVKYDTENEYFFYKLLIYFMSLDIQLCLQ